MEIILAIIAAVMAAAAWGKKQYKRGRSDGGVDVVDLERRSFEARRYLETVTQEAKRREAAAVENARREAERLAGRRPDARDLDDLLRDADERK